MLTARKKRAVSRYARGPWRICLMEGVSQVTEASPAYPVRVVDHHQSHT